MILVLISIALKSLVIAGATLGLLELMRHRSAAERSWVAHVGLLALVLLALAPLVLPNWNLEAPALFGQAPTQEVAVQASATAPAATITTAPVAATAVPAAPVPAPPRFSVSPAAAMTALYALPAAILLFITFLALGRLITLRARAEVLVDGHWLSALARAQRRMGFKHGTALLTSDELSSPISWGLMRPVILLNARAVEASGEAEAIIAHELAHVARMDWIKLLLARVATALFWFNPFVWLLAREAHQLREEAADDSVLAANITDTDYAELLVGVARHECPGLLLGAHGVAPSKKSLARRVARVLDGKSVRGPVARSFALGVLVGAVLVAAPLAALNLTPGGATVKPSTIGGSKAGHGAIVATPYYPSAQPTDLPHIIASGVATSVQTAVAAVNPEKARQQARADAIADALATAREARADAIADAQGAAAEARTAIHARTGSDGQIDALIEMKAAGVTPEYVNAMRSISPQLRSMPPANFAGMKSVGVTPEFARELAAAGFHNLNANDLAAARSVGVTGDYARGMVAVGVPPNLGELIQLRAVGVPVPYVIQIRNSGVSVHNAEKVIEMWAVGVKPGDVRGLPATNRGLPAGSPPRPPTPPNPNVVVTIDTDGG